MDILTIAGSTCLTFGIMAMLYAAYSIFSAAFNLQSAEDFFGSLILAGLFAVIAVILFWGSYSLIDVPNSWDPTSLFGLTELSNSNPNSTN